MCDADWECYSFIEHIPFILGLGETKSDLVSAFMELKIEQTKCIFIRITLMNVITD